MTRILVHVEGETEETFVNEVLAPHLYAVGYTNVSARLVGNARQRDRRGGIRAWHAVRSDIVRHLKEDQGCAATLMVDYYGLPQSWPNRSQATVQPFPQNAILVESGILSDVVAEMGPEFGASRFIPYVMMHEFEGLLFSDCDGFGQAVGRPDLVSHFQKIRDAFDTPEHINDSPVTAPSKRVESLMPGYQKPLSGTLAVIEIGLKKIRDQCPRFRCWLEQLEARATKVAGEAPSSGV
jgi:hypothetical protein